MPEMVSACLRSSSAARSSRYSRTSSCVECPVNALNLSVQLHPAQTHVMRQGFCVVARIGDVLLDVLREFLQEPLVYRRDLASVRIPGCTCRSYFSRSLFLSSIRFFTRAISSRASNGLMT